MSSFPHSSFSPLHPSHPIKPEPNHPSEIVDMTAPEVRYRIRACYTILAQINSLLRDIQANPHPEAVPEEYIPYQSLGDDDTIAPVDITTPRPLKRVPRDIFAADDDANASSAPFASPSDGLEDGRLTAFAAVARGAPHDPRLATIQGLLQHVEQLVLESYDPLHPAPAGVYPTWIAPQLSSVLGLINTMYPTEQRKERDRIAKQKAAEFRQRALLAAQEDMDARRFEAFLDRNLEVARERKAKLDEIQTARQLEQAAKEVGSSAREAGKRGSSASLKKSKSGTSFASSDPFAGMSSEEEHNEKLRLERRATHLRSLSPKSRQAFIAAESRSSGVRGGAGVRDKSHRPEHEKPFGYGSHKKKRIGDALPPVVRNTKYDAKPRKAPGLLEPRKQYAVPTSKEKYQEYLRREQSRNEFEGEAGIQAQEREEDMEDVELDQQEQAEFEQEEERRFSENESHTFQQQQEQQEEEEEEEDPFAAHDPDVSTTKRQRSGPARFEESKEQEDAFSFADSGMTKRPSRLRLDQDEEQQQQGHPDDDEDDPFSVHSGSSRLKGATPSKQSIRAQGNAMSPNASTKSLKRSSSNTSTKKATSSFNSTLTSPALSRASSTLKRTPSASGSKKKSSAPASTPGTAQRKVSLANKTSDPFSPDHSLSRSSLNSADPEDWRGIELRLLAMQEDLKQSSSFEVKEQVSAALAKLTETMHDLGSSPSLLDDHDPEDSGSDMNTLQWDAALHNVLAGGKKIVRSESRRSGVSGGASKIGSPRIGTGSFPFSPSATSLHSPSLSPQQTDQLSSVTQALASTQVELASQRSEHARLEQEKKELQEALQQLQERDAQHAKSLFHLMDKLNSLNAAAARQGRKMDLAGSRRVLKDASFIAPFGSPVSSSSRSPHPHSSQGYGRGSRSLKVPRPDEIEYEASLEQQGVEGLEDSVVLGGRDDVPEAKTQEEISKEQTEQRLLELATELDRVQAANVALKEKLDAANFQSAVLSKTSEQQKLFMSQQLVHMSEQDRIKEATRAEMAQKQHQEDLRKIQGNERVIQEMKEEQRRLKATLQSEKTSSESKVRQLLDEIQALSEEKSAAQSEAAIMRARVEQLTSEQAALRGNRRAAGSRFATPNKLGATASSYGSPHTPGAFDPIQAITQMEDSTASHDFFAFLAQSFRGDYLKVRHNVTLSHTLTQQALLAHQIGLQSSEIEEVLFSDYVTKYNRRNSGQQRVLILTSTALYNFVPKKYELRRRIAIKDISSISLSRLCTDLVVLHHSSEHDYLLTSPKRSELMFHLQAAYKKLMNGHHSLAYEFSERLYVKDKGGMMRDVQILDSQSFKLGKAFGMQGTGETGQLAYPDKILKSV